MNTKKCISCNQVLPKECFTVAIGKPSKKTGERREWLSSYCKECATKKGGEHYLKKKYGISSIEKTKMLKDQENKCAICKTSFLGAKGTHVDHCHETGKIRNLLCMRCNVGLGNFKDNTDLLRKAIEYLEIHKKQKLA
jgi:hypothetical protein